MNVLSLFAGIGGFDIGLARAGMKTIAFAEIEPYCRRVLRHHWPDVHQFDDVKDIVAHDFYTSGLPWPDVICGGFPCQDISYAGLGAGLAGMRSGLWFEYARIIGEFRPSWVIIENVPALRSRGLDQVLRSLAAIGYDAEWNCIPAAAFGAPHRRDRIWIVAYPDSGQQPDGRAERIRRRSEGAGGGQSVRLDPNAESIGCGAGRAGRLTDRLAWIRDIPRWNPADTDDTRLEIGQGVGSDARPQRPAIERDFIPHVWQSRWTDEPALCGMDDGVSKGVDVGLYALGNSIVPQIAEAIGRAIMSYEAELENGNVPVE